MTYINKIIGNDFLISIAYNASSPTEAAKVASLAGYPKDLVRAVRDAAKLKRDEGEDTFNRTFSPWKRLDTDIKGYSSLELSVMVDRIYEKRQLNAKEMNEVINDIIQTLARKGVKVSTPFLKEETHIKSSLT